MRIVLTLEIDGSGVYRKYHADSEDDIFRIDWRAQVEDMTDSIMSHNPLDENEKS